MEGRRTLKSLTLANVLSFGPEAMRLHFEPLNVLIGSNGSGKSNLIEVLDLIRSLPKDLSSVFRQSGLREWFWKGTGAKGNFHIGGCWEESKGNSLNHDIILTSENDKPSLSLEVVVRLEVARARHFMYCWISTDDLPAETRFPLIVPTGTEEPLLKLKKGFRTDQSVLAQYRDTDKYSEFSFLSDSYSQIRLYRNWTFGRDLPIRRLQLASLPDEFLAEDASNLAVVIRRLQRDSDAYDAFRKALVQVYLDVVDVHVKEIGDYLELSLKESEERSIPASRLSDGTLRYLSLLAILCDPNPSPLIAIEEPELGLHPDIIPTIARLLIDASHRTQLIVTTHSSDLISALGDVPEAVVVCERGFDGTTMERLDPERMKGWLEKYSLGHLWSTGEIGGNRW